ncbi:hypothetical protein EI94DRAFT_1773444 [Lactarius quietus]|nr:hypothetical protein EI94DRAFT_1773444 [Lactarius quietus]
MDVWAAYQQIYDVDAAHRPPFANSQDLYNAIDSMEIGGVAWQAFAMEFDGDVSDDNATPLWKRKLYEVQIANKVYACKIDYLPKWMFSSVGKHQYTDFMSANWEWEQVDLIVKDSVTHGSMFVPVILGSDKTTVSVATGNNEYYPLYILIGNVHNHVWRAHRNAVSLVRFLAIPKTNRQHEDSLECVIYGLGPYIADYPEQVLLACVVSGWCPNQNFFHCSHFDSDPFMTQFPRANMHELLSPDLLHQVIKGTFKDHLVDWVVEYLDLIHGKTHVKEILADIDQQ